MAALTFQSTPNKDRSHNVVKSTTDGIGSSTATIVVDNTKSRTEVMDALNAALRAVSREFSKVSTTAAVPTSGTTVE